MPKKKFGSSMRVHDPGKENKKAEAPEKPVAPGDRVMAGGPYCAGESPATAKNLARRAGNIAANRPPIRRKR